IAGEKTENLHSRQVRNPANIAEVVGEVIDATENHKHLQKSFALYTLHFLPSLLAETIQYHCFVDYNTNQQVLLLMWLE
ncbi:hypothetical protein KZ327_10625, partial [Glaesserella parasuis]|nr:hypothetical protein [Glaesserella parasuis]